MASGKHGPAWFSVRVLFFTVCSVLLAGKAAWAQTTDDFYDDSVLQEVQLTMDPADWATLLANYTQNTRYPVSFQWRNTTVTQSGIRARGSGSRNPIKPGLEVDFDYYVSKQSFLGNSTVYMKNLSEEPSMLTERLSMKMFRRMGLPAPREAHVKVYLNGSYLGLFLLVESIDTSYVQRNLGNNNGTIYEYDYDDSYHFEDLGSDPTLYTPTIFSPSPKKDPNPQLLASMIQAINQSSDSNFLSAVSQYCDPRLFMAHVAMEDFLTEEDGMVSDAGMENFYVYRRGDKDFMQFLAWDKDYTFHNLMRQISWNTDTNVFTRRGMANSDLRNAYLDTLANAAAAAGNGTTGWLYQEAQREYQQIEQAALDDPIKQCGTHTCTQDEFEADVQVVLQFAQYRAQAVLQQLQTLRGGSATSGQFTISPGNIVSSAPGQDAIAPGGLVTYSGNLQLQGTTSASSTFPLATSLGGVSILVNNVAVPLLSVSSIGATFQLPWDVIPGTVGVQITNGTGQSNWLTVRTPPSAPGIFSVTHADGSAVSTSKPAQSGETVVIYATGLGAVQTAQTSGVPSTSVVSLTQTASVLGGSSSNQVVFSGLLPGFIGLYQVNVQLGTLNGTGDALALRVNDQGSANVSITQ